MVGMLLQPSHKGFTNGSHPALSKGVAGIWLQSCFGRGDACVIRRVYEVPGM